ncbi:hypothetical protein SADUNF_Sadunf05G0175100 [Salix dunnii]|uniref:Uncharacterized protein n=1 Tax=Salix dunnii TaxID=1413687 RepID=A0A835KBZ3_9ROSI|nr:hypothetical protein SADUNF_Sadunf05G0175100 [Salix dunnii]
MNVKYSWVTRQAASTTKNLGVVPVLVTGLRSCSSECRMEKSHRTRGFVLRDIHAHIQKSVIILLSAVGHLPSLFPGHLYNLIVYMTVIRNFNFEALNILKSEQT